MELEADTENLSVQEEFDGIGTVIFEWDQAFKVVAYDEREEQFRKEFLLDERSWTALFDLIDDLDNNRSRLMES